MEKMANFTQFEQKNTHISGCKIVHLCTIATVIVHIYTVTVACAFNILLVFSLSCLCSHSHSHLTLSLFLLSPHLTPPSSLPSSLVGTEPNSSLLVVKVVVLVLEFLWVETKLLSFSSSSSFTNPSSLDKSSSSSTKKSSQEQRRIGFVNITMKKIVTRCFHAFHFCFTLQKQTKPKILKDGKNLSKKTQNLFHSVVWMFCGYFIMKWRIVIIVWLMRKWERGGLGLWERERERWWGRWVSDWVCEREAVRERK